MKSKARYLVPLLILLAIVSFLGYRYRGRIRIAMLDFLHSFDDTGQEDSRETAQRENSPAGDDSDEQEQLELIRSLGYLSGYEDALHRRAMLLLTIPIEPVTVTTCLSQDMLPESV